MYKNHPSKPKIIVLPDLREIMNTNNDVPINIIDLWAKYESE